MPRESVDPQSYDYLLMKKIAERVPNNSYAILGILEEDSNIDLYALLYEYVYNDRGKIGLEDMQGYIRCHVWSNEHQQQKALNIVCELGAKDEEIVQEATYLSLLYWCVDFQEIASTVEDQLNDAR